MTHTPPPPPSYGGFLTVDEVADRLRVSRNTVHDWITTGRLTAHRLSNRVVRIAQADLQAFLADRRTEAS